MTQISVHLIPLYPQITQITQSVKSVDPIFFASISTLAVLIYVTFHLVNRLKTKYVKTSGGPRRCKRSYRT